MNVRPSRTENAIKVVAFAFQFERSFTLGELSVLESLHEGANDSLPRKQRLEALTIQFNPASPGIQTSAQPNTGGITFDRLTPTGEAEWAFTAKDNTAVVQCTVYSRWEEIWGNARAYVERFLPVLGENNRIISAGLEYLDEFVILDEKTDWISDLFDRNSKHLTQNMFETDSYWHCHTGFFSPTQDDRGRFLTRINLDYINNNEAEHVVVSKMQHQLQLVEAIPFPEFLQNDMNGFIEDMHNLNKSVLFDMLSNEMAAAIKLEIK